jgi:hypothetical protein
VTDQARKSATGRPRYCRGCGSQVRPGLEFCTECGLAVGPGRAMPIPSPPVTGQHAPAITQPRPNRSPGPDRQPTQWRIRHLATGTAVLLVVGLATGAIVMAHPFGRQKLAAASSVSASRRATASRSPESPSAGPSTSPGPPSPGSAPSGTSPFTQQQAAVNLATLLARSADARQTVNAAYSDVNQCGPSLAQDVQAFQAAATSHRQLLSELANMPGMSALPQAMVRDLSSAWQASASADADFAQWAQDEVENGCSPASQSDPNYAAADGPDVQATASKTAFVQLWNPIAQAAGLTTYAQSDL